MTRLVAVGLALACFAVQDRPVFKSASRTVTVYATVQSRDGRLVADLRRDEFTVLDNGKPAPMWFALNAAMTSIEDQPGRRVVLALTDGRDTDVAARRGNALGVNRDDVRRHGETVRKAIGLAVADARR